MYRVIKQHINGRIVLLRGILHSDKISTGMLCNDGRDRLNRVTRVVRRN